MAIHTFKWAIRGETIVVADDPEEAREKYETKISEFFGQMAEELFGINTNPQDGISTINLELKAKDAS
jgi:hypothetical protein